MKTKTDKVNAPALDASIKTLKQYIEEFNEHLGRSIESLIKAAKCYTEAVNIFGKEARDGFRDAIPSIPESVWRSFVEIAGRKLSPKVLTLTSATLVDTIRKLPYEKQVEVLGDIDEEPRPMPVLSRGAVAIKPITGMNASELNSLIDKKAGTIRTVEQQMQSAEAKLRARLILPAWEIKGETLAIHRTCILQGVELDALIDALDKMRNGAKSSKRKVS